MKLKDSALTQLDRFNAMYNKHVGETCLIIGNGPSLRDVPISWLGMYPTFGANRIYLLDDFLPTYYVCVNHLVIDQHYVEIMELGGGKLPKFLTVAGVSDRYNVLSLASNPAPMFSYYPPGYIYEGHTVTFVSLQLAFFMGFSTALLIGVDHRYTYVGEPNEENVWDGDDPNHFSPQYFKGERWNNPDLQRSEEAYHMAKVAYERNGRKVVNITPGTDLGVFEKNEAQVWMN